MHCIWIKEHRVCVCNNGSSCLGVRVGLRGPDPNGSLHCTVSMVSIHQTILCPLSDWYFCINHIATYSRVHWRNAYDLYGKIYHYMKAIENHLLVPYRDIYTFFHYVSSREVCLEGRNYWHKSSCWRHIICEILNECYGKWYSVVFFCMFFTCLVLEILDSKICFSHKCQKRSTVLVRRGNQYLPKQVGKCNFV